MKRARTAPMAAAEDVHIQEFLDMIAPSVIKFETDHFICGNTYRCVWALREYPTATDEQAILSHLGEKDGVTLRIYTRHVTPVEEKKIISNAANKNRMDRSNTNDLQQTVLAESNLQDVTTIVAQMHRNREPLLHAAVYLELCAHDIDQLKLLQTEVLTELIRSKLNVDRLMLRQQQGFQCVMPTGWNLFRDQFERVLPASSVANLYPFNYSGKTDPQGFYIGRDKFGSNVLVDFNRRADDKTNANILILGNSGQGKSYLLKFLLTNLRESGMRVCALDPEMEYEDLTNNLGGCFIDLMGGRYIINPLCLWLYKNNQNQIYLRLYTKMRNIDILMANTNGGASMFHIDKTLLNPNIPVTIRFTQQLIDWLQEVKERENISFNQVVLQCCKNGMESDLAGRNDEEAGNDG